MVHEGKKRAERESLLDSCDFTVGNAESLAFPDRSFDAYTIAFGIRNVTHIDPPDAPVAVVGHRPPG